MYRFYIQNIQLRCRQTHGGHYPLLAPRRRDRLNKVEFGFGVREFLELFDLQASIFVGNDVCDEDRFAGTFNPD
jgi:hypothetical protein